MNKQCNWIHQLSWTSKLQWSGSVPFNAEPIKEWFVDSKNSTGEAAGEWREHGGLTYVTVRGAGHSEYLPSTDRPNENGGRKEREEGGRREETRRIELALTPVGFDGFARALHSGPLR